jgi:hypothetical protein
MKIEYCKGNPLPVHFFEKDFDEMLGWLHQAKAEIQRHTDLDIEILRKMVFHKHIAMLCRLKTKITPSTIINILSQLVKDYPGGYRPWFTYDHYSEELMICAYPFYKGRLMEDQAKNGY